MQQLKNVYMKLMRFAIFAFVPRSIHVGVSLVEHVERLSIPPFETFVRVKPAESVQFLHDPLPEIFSSFFDN